MQKTLVGTMVTGGILASLLMIGVPNLGFPVCVGNISGALLSVVLYYAQNGDIENIDYYESFDGSKHYR